jgi:Protein of unknown function (DUF551)
MEWIDIKERKPTKNDSPILAIGSLNYFDIMALEYLEQGFDGSGWYDHSREYGMGFNENEAFYDQYGGMNYWMPLPRPPHG